jgi:hypothetical protein
MSFFKKILSSFESNEEKFKKAMKKHLIGSLNNLKGLNFTKFPVNINGISTELSKENNLNVLAENKSINFLEVIKFIVYRAEMMHNSDSNSYFRDLINEQYDLIISNDSSFKISKEEFSNILEIESSKYHSLLSQKDIIFSYSLLYDSECNYENLEQYYGLFTSYYLITGYFANVIAHSAFILLDEINDFFTSCNLKEFKSLDCFENADLVKRIYDKNLKIGLFEENQLNKLQNNILKGSNKFGSLDVGSMVDWFTFVLIYEGFDKPTSENLIINLKEKLSKKNSKWVLQLNYFMMYNKITSLNYTERVELMTDLVGLIYTIHYSPNY